MAPSSTSDEILNFSSQFSLYTSYALFIVGIIGNTLNILAFTHLKLFRDNRCAFYLTIEAIVNNGYLITYLAAAALTAVYGNDPAGSSLVYCRMRSTLFQTFSLISFSMVCLAAADQFFSTNHRFSWRQLCTLKLARCLAFVASCLWLLHSILFCLFMGIDPSFGCIILNPAWTLYSSLFFYPVLIGLLPIAIASLFSFLAFRNVRHIVRRQVPIVRRRLDRQMTTIVLVRVIVFVICSLPYDIYRIYAISFPIPHANLLQFAVGRLLQTMFTFFIGLNFVGNFYIFLASSSRYRRQVKHVLVKKYWRRCIRCCCANQNQVASENIASVASNIELE